MGVQNRNNDTETTGYNKSNGGFKKARIEAYANFEPIMEDGSTIRFPKGLAISADQLHHEDLFNIVEDLKETDSGTIEFTVMTKVTLRLNKANGDRPAARVKRSYK